MEYISAKEAAAKWNITQRRVVTLCSEKRIENAVMVGNMWIIPSDAEKPEDARSTRYSHVNNSVKPFLKWAGGKGQILKEISQYYPFKNGIITKYAEPFVGGGAVLFDILGKYSLEEIYISDTNKDLINTYIVVRDNIDELIQMLSGYQSDYNTFDTEVRKAYYIAKRNRYNELTVGKNFIGNIEKAALMIFLNKTCFNGLYRVNKKGEFNVPIGSYKNPLICDEQNLRAASESLQNVSIVCSDYRKSADFIDDKTFVYIDPPYRPLPDAASFTAYTEIEFGDKEHIELAKFANSLSLKGARIVVSNSDPKNTDENDNFFDEIYCNFRINRIYATRMINSKGDSRGKIKELLISNY